MTAKFLFSSTAKWCAPSGDTAASRAEGNSSRLQNWQREQRVNRWGGRRTAYGWQPCNIICPVLFGTNARTGCLLAFASHTKWHLKKWLQCALLCRVGLILIVQIHVCQLLAMLACGICDLLPHTSISFRIFLFTYLLLNIDIYFRCTTWLCGGCTRKHSRDHIDSLADWFIVSLTFPEKNNKSDES